MMRTLNYYIQLCQLLFLWLLGCWLVKLSISMLLLALVLTNVSYGQKPTLKGTYPSIGGPITIEVISNGKAPVNTGFLQFLSNGGYLIPPPEPDPFSALLDATSKKVTYSNLGHGNVKFNKGVQMELDMEYHGPGGTDIKAFWGNGAKPTEFAVSSVLVTEPTYNAFTAFGMFALGLLVAVRTVNYGKIRN